METLVQNRELVESAEDQWEKKDIAGSGAVMHSQKKKQESRISGGKRARKRSACLRKAFTSAKKKERAITECLRLNYRESSRKNAFNWTEGMFLCIRTLLRMIKS